MLRSNFLLRKFILETGEPFLISGGVAGLISLGLILGHGLHKYISTVKDRNNDIETAQRSLALLQMNICTFRSSQSKIGHHGLAVDGLAIGVINCEEQLQSLQVLLDGYASTEATSVLRKTYKGPKMRVQYLRPEKAGSSTRPALKSKHNFEPLCQYSYVVSGLNRKAMRDDALNLYRESVLDISRDLTAVRGLSTTREMWDWFTRSQVRKECHLYSIYHGCRRESVLIIQANRQQVNNCCHLIG